jgi:glucose/mannose-6-phosphate isomerase
VNERTLVIALSYSGNTAEALACYAEAKARGSQLMVISAGGELTERATADGVPSHHITYRASPRAALAHTLAPLVRLGQRLGLVTMCDADIAAVANAHEQLVRGHLNRDIPADSNPAKQIAEFVLDGSPIVVFGAQHLAPAARRAKNQLAENAKLLALFEEIPEAAHNIVVGLDGPPSGTPVGLAFDSPKLAAANRRRTEALGQHFAEAGGELAGLPTRGISRLADQFEATAWGDFISCYAALLRGIDPTPTPALARMREAMSAEPAAANIANAFR